MIKLIPTRSPVHAVALLALMACQALRAAGSDAVPQATAPPAATPVHGMWIWRSSTVLQAPQAPLAIRNFCAGEGINEIYVTISRHYGALEALQLGELIGQMHQAGIRVEALISSTDADEPGAPRTHLIDQVQSVLQFNHEHWAARFDGVHLDVEPQQRDEYKGADDIGYLPGLIDTYRAVRRLTDRAGISLNADVPPRLLRAQLLQRRALLSAVPRLTLLLYDTDSTREVAATELARLRESSGQLLASAYAGLDGGQLARMLIGLRSADYGAQLPQMLAALDQTYSADPHYLGWARQSYNDILADGAPGGASSGTSRAPFAPSP
jgi:hypothetical protein